MNNSNKPLVGVIMGSDSDLPVMKPAADILERLGVAYEMLIVSAHRTPARLYDYASGASRRGLKVIVAGAGGAAHLPGMTAAMTDLPVIGVPKTIDNDVSGTVMTFGFDTAVSTKISSGHGTGSAG